MFRYSKKWLDKISKYKIDHEELYKIIYEAGFEYGGITKYDNDELVEIEVKANRPDVLCQYGVLREYYAYKKYDLPELKTTLNLEKGSASDLGLKVDIDADICQRMVLLKMENIDNSGQTPPEIKEMLERYKIKSINPVVDYGNYSMLEMGQPFHIYDYDKLTTKNIKVAKSNVNKKFKTLNGTNIEVLDDTIMIKDGDNNICIAGIIGGKEVEVDSNTKTIIIEAANFNEVLIRKSSKKLGISTMASYRFERKTDASVCLLDAKLLAENILNICGGKVVTKYYDSCDKVPKKTLEVSVKRINTLLGTNLSSSKMTELLTQYYFKITSKNEDILIIEIPHYRLDISIEADIAEEVARIYGYKNIEPTIPTLTTPIHINETYENMKIARNLLVDLGFYECLNYGFIPYNTMEKLELTKTNKYYGNIMLQNPLSNKYQLMRPLLINGLIENLIYNLTKNTANLKLMEIGRVFYKDSKTDTGYIEHNSLALLINGVRIKKGFGIDKDIDYFYYDIANYLNVLMQKFNIKYEIDENDLPFLDNSCNGKILVNNEEIGYIGMIKPSILKNYENGKLISKDVYVLELNIDKLTNNKTAISYYKNYPSVIREYNLLVNEDTKFKTCQDKIREFSSDIYKVRILDIYQGKGVPYGKKSILISIEYNNPTKTLTAEEIERLENNLLAMLKSEFNIELKS